MMQPEQTIAALPPPSVAGNVWRIFVSYRRSELTTSIAHWLKEELERETIVSTTGQIFSLDVFVDAAEPHRPDFQANLVPRLRHSRALIVLADEGAAFRRKPPFEDYLYEELDWWAKQRRSAPPIILQLDKSALNLVGDPALVKWRKVNFLPCSWESWSSGADGGQMEKARLLSQVRESICTYGEIVHLEEVRRLRRRAYVAAAFALAALVAASLSYRQSQESQRQRERAEAQTVIARSESNAAALAAAHFASTSGDLSTARNWLDGINPTQRAWEWFYLRGMTDTAIAAYRQTDEYLGSRIQWEKLDFKSIKEDKLTVVAFSPDESLVAAGSENGKLLLWDSRSGKCLHDAHVSEGISSIAFDPDGHSIAVGSLDGSLLLFDLKTTKIAKLSEEEGVVSVVLYTAHGRLISAAWDGSITIWDTDRSSKVIRYTYPEAKAELEKMEDANTAEFKKDPVHFHMSDSDQVIKLTKGYNSVEDRFLHLYPIGASFLGAVPTGDGHSVWAEMGDGVFRVDLRTWYRERVPGGIGRLSGVSLVGGLRPVVVQRELVKQGQNYFDGRILGVWEPGRPEHKIDGRKLGASAQVLGLSPDGTRLAVSSENRVDIYRFRGLSLEQRLAGHDLPVNDVAFLPNGSRLATASDDGHVKIWDLDHPKLRPSIQAHSRPVTAIVFRSF